MEEVHTVEVPFSFRRQCWFCGEPHNGIVNFPHHHYIVLDCPHPKLNVPSCDECRLLVYKQKVNNVWQLKREIKKSLISLYRKDLAIGVNWTEQELADSGFEGGNFAGFQRSAWFIYQVAKQRVNFSGWALSINGVELFQDSFELSFEFDDVIYPSIDEAIIHYSKIIGVTKEFIRQTVDKIGSDRFADAVRFCRLHIGATPNERAVALRELS